MVVLNPTIPSCDCSDDAELIGDVITGVSIKPDGEGEIEYFELNKGDVEAFRSLFCAECDHAFIRAGNIVDERVTGKVI